MLTEESIQELRSILREEYGVEFDPADTAEAGEAFLGYFATLTKVYKKNYDNK